MRDFKVLKLLDQLKPLFEKIGINYRVMRKIIQIKLLMDGRRVPTVYSKRSNSQEEKDNKFLLSLGIYTLMGLILIPFIMMKNNYIFQMSFVFGIVLFFIMSSLISDFSSVLLDIKDKNIIAIRPVDLKTLRMAKTIHVTIYMIYITIALVGPAFLVSIYTQGIVFFFLFIFVTIIIDIFCIVLTSLVYSFILRFFDGEKLKDIINYVQIVLSLVIAIGYQFVGRLFNLADITITFVPKWWEYLIIPVWFSAPFQMLKKGEINTTLVIFTGLAILIPIITMLVYILKMTEFEQNLNKLSNNYQNKNKDKKVKQSILCKLLCRTKEEKIFYHFASDIMRQEREFKLKVYPNLGFAIIFPFIFLIQKLANTSLRELSKGDSYLLIYLCGIMIPTVIIMMQCSEKYKGAWIYKVMPIEHITLVFKGTMKALLGKLFLPVYTAEAFVFIGLYGVRIIPDILLIFSNMMIYSILCFMLFDKVLPFSRPSTAVQNSGFGINMILMIIFAVLAWVHFIVIEINYGIYINLVASLVANIVLWKRALKIPPEKLFAN